MIRLRPEYVAWFNRKKAASYGDSGSPWTRLGYTYDWGNPDSEVGLSEFVADTGAEVIIHAVYDIHTYCRRR